MRFTFVILLFCCLGADAQMIIKAHANYRPYAVAAQNLLLDDYPNAMAAFSVRKLDKDYAGNCLRLRRSNDNTEQDFGFVNNFLDTNSIKTFCSTNDCFLTVWYDQSGQSRNATQSTAVNQPLYILGNSVNDLLGIRFEKKSSIALRLNVNLPLQDVASIISVNTDATQDATNSIHKPILAGRDTSVYVDNARGYGFGKLRQGSNGFRFGGPSLGLQASNQIQSTYTQTNTRELIFGVNNQASYSLFKNGVSLGTQTGTNRTSGFITGYSIGASEGGSLDRLYTGRLSELIIYGSNQSSNRTGIETNINSFYAIY
jgi:hypothetical protein